MPKVYGNVIFKFLGSLFLLAMLAAPRPAGAVSSNVTWPENYVFDNPLVVMSTTAASLSDMTEDTQVYFWVLQPSGSGGVSLVDPSDKTQTSLNPDNAYYKAKMHIRGQSTLGAVKPQFSVDITHNEDGKVFLDMPFDGSHWVFNDAGTYDYTMIRNMLAFDMQRTLGADTGSGAWAPRGEYFELFAVTGRDDSVVDQAPSLQEITNGYAGVYLNLEEIEADPNRIDINTKYSAPDASNAVGGMIVQVNSPRAGEDDKLVLAGGKTSVGNTSNEVVVQWPKIDKLGAAEQTAINNWYYPVNGFNPSYPAGYGDNFTGWAFMFTNNPGYITTPGDINTSMIHPSDYWSMVKDFTDLQSFAEYLLLNEVAKDPDGYHRSTFMYRKADALGADGRTITPGKMYAGPLWDKNKSYANTHPSYSAFGCVDGWSYEIAGQAPWWWETLASSPDFQAAVQEAWEKGSAAGGAFDSERVAKFITKQQEYLNSSGAYGRDYEMFYLGQTAPDHQSTCDASHLSNWVTERLAWMDQNIGTITGSN